MTSQETKNKLTLLQEVIEKEEKYKFDQRERDLELYKNLFNTLTTKVSETVKLEIDARFQADMDNKSLAHTIAQRLMNEIDLLKRDIDKTTKDTRDSVKNNNHECSDRAHNLSKYIDQQISGNNESLLRKYDNIKTLMSKLTDQFKSHILFHDEQMKSIQGKLQFNGDSSSSIKDELMSYTMGIEERFQKKYKDLTNYLETIWKANISIVNERVDLLSSKTDKNFVLLSQELVDTRKIFANRIDESDNLQSLQFKCLVEDLEGIVAKTNNYEILLEKFEKNNYTLNKKVEANIADLIAKINTWQINDKVIKNIAHQEMMGEVDKVRDDLIQFSQHVEHNIQDILKNLESNYLSLMEKSKHTVEQINKLSDNNLLTFKQLENNIITLSNETNKIEINNLMSSMMDKIDQDNIINLIDSVKLENLDLNKDFDLKLNLLNDNLRNLELKTLMDDMITQVEKSFIEKQIEKGGNEKNEKILLLNLNDLKQKLETNSMKMVDLEKEIIETNDNINKNLNKRLSEIAEQIHNIENSKPDLLLQNIESQIVIDEMMNKLEFNNIYSIFNNLSTTDRNSKDISTQLSSFNERLVKIDKEITESTTTTKKVINEYNGVIDSKVNNIMEKLKKENQDMWTNSLQMTYKAYTPEEIKKILKSIPPVVIPRVESKKMIKELEAILEHNPRPKLVSPWEKIINYRQDFQYDVLNNIKDEGEEEIKTELGKKNAKDRKKIEDKKANPTQKSNQDTKDTKTNNKKDKKSKEDKNDEKPQTIDKSKTRDDRDKKTNEDDIDEKTQPVDKSKTHDNEEQKNQADLNKSKDQSKSFTFKDESKKEASLKKKKTIDDLNNKKVEDNKINEIENKTENKKENDEKIKEVDNKNEKDGKKKEQKDFPKKNEIKKNK